LDETSAEKSLPGQALAGLPSKPSGSDWAMDFFTVPTMTFGVLYCFFVIGHDRRRILHVNVTKQPTSGCISQQLLETFPFAASHKYLESHRYHSQANFIPKSMAEGLCFTLHLLSTL
jgi:hypothetical protein